MLQQKHQPLVINLFYMRPIARVATSLVGETPPARHPNGSKASLKKHCLDTEPFSLIGFVGKR